MAMQEPDPRIGDLIVTRYLLMRSLGRGAMGQVYLARDMRLNKYVALKFLVHAPQSQEMCDRFLTEALACAQLGARSNHIVEVTDYGKDAQGIPFLVMEYLEGHSLDQKLKSQPLPLGQFLRFIEQICLGLKCAHEGIEIGNSNQRYPVIHCDLKPSNIFVTPDETWDELVKILDFGVARLMQTNTQTVFGGTYRYCSPEQMEGKKVLDPRSDIYSLGIVMFEMLTNRHPRCPRTLDFRGWFDAHCNQPPRRIKTIAPDMQLPSPLENLIMACLEKAPAQRPQSIAEVLGGMRSLSEYQSISHPTYQPVQPSNTLAIAENLNIHQTTAEYKQIPVFPTNRQSQNILCQPVSDPSRMPALWVKLPHRHIQTIQIYRLYNKVYQNFLFCQPPEHPGLLWITAIYNPRVGCRWFTCFLDLSTGVGRELVYLLAGTGTYQYLFFDAEAPHWFSHHIIRRLKTDRTVDESALIRQAAIASQLPSAGSPQASYERLKAKYLSLRPEIEKRMSSNEWADRDG
ncbi:MAG: serine/threonine-protein kinase [Leptolyngbyaceae cyanobacterium bins.349]|nr:serine/threonine-protein kinase [Leptolyngbyaceae cyanobacterium bins.349]